MHLARSVDLKRRQGPSQRVPAIRIDGGSDGVLAAGCEAHRSEDGARVQSRGVQVHFKGDGKMALRPGQGEQAALDAQTPQSHRSLVIRAGFGMLLFCRAPGQSIGQGAPIA